MWFWLLIGRLLLTWQGVPEAEVASVVEDTIDSVGLRKYSDSCAGTYSGGNKRKLSLGIALVSSLPNFPLPLLLPFIPFPPFCVLPRSPCSLCLHCQVGNPAAVLLDEPSSGMDPLARRTMWGIITRAALSGGASVILTTHSMEECEALCSRVGLMQAGRLVCLGSIQHLKSRFGEGWFVFPT